MARSHFLSRSIPIVVLVFLLLPALTVSGANRPKVEHAGGRITITAEEVTLGSIAEELSRQAGITVYLDRSEEARRVSADVKNLSFEKGIRTLVHPLNYAIVTDRDGRITELRIFKNTGTKENAYRVFTAPRNTAAPSTEPARQAARALVSAQPASQPTSSTRAGSAVFPKTAHQAEGLAGPSALVSGERAFQYNIWMNQRLKETEQIRQSIWAKTDQIEAQERQTAAITARTHASVNVQQAGTAPPVQGPQAQGSQTVQGSQMAAVQQNLTQTQLFMQSNTQQRGFNNYIYHQQRAMRDSYSFYNMRRGQ